MATYLVCQLWQGASESENTTAKYAFKDKSSISSRAYRLTPQIPVATYAVLRERVYATDEVAFDYSAVQLSDLSQIW